MLRPYCLRLCYAAMRRDLRARTIRPSRPKAPKPNEATVVGSGTAAGVASKVAVEPCAEKLGKVAPKYGTGMAGERPVRPIVNVPVAEVPPLAARNAVRSVPPV